MNMWHIYNNTYDLTNYIDKHPGGKDILIKTKGQADITALFETYHAFSDKNKIMDILHKYKVDPTDNLESKQLCKYDFTNYNNLVNEVKKILFELSIPFISFIPSYTGLKKDL